MAICKKLLLIVFLALPQFSVFACSYVSAVDVFYEKGKTTLTDSENKKLQEWFQSSLKMFPIVGSLSIEANAYAPNLEDAKALAKKRGDLTKDALSQKLPVDTLIRVVSYGHTKPKLDVLPSTDVVFIDITPDVEKMKLPPCLPQPPAKPN
ncbi:hypothetical protein [Comamonas sp. 4034]|uniref:hypothetical protein n=1 Tax=Comamonas sp. 4034 TaxID=3156455 RepID=UPI003D1EDB9B